MVITAPPNTPYAVDSVGFPPPELGKKSKSKRLNILGVLPPESIPVGLTLPSAFKRVKITELKS